MRKVLQSYLLNFNTKEELKIYKDFQNKCGMRKYKEVILTMMKNFK
tara:strand:- start:2796 stop:2933 length:138 start_codon:yes stop_codon:yes gene_type:complete